MSMILRTLGGTRWKRLMVCVGLAMEGWYYGGNESGKGMEQEVYYQDIVVVMSLCSCS